MVKNGTQKWKEADDDFLRQHEGGTAKEIRAAMMKEMGIRRSERAIQRRAKFIGVTVHHGYKGVWSDEEKKLLRAHSLDGTEAAWKAVLAINPHRTYASVVKKMQEWDLKDRRCRTCGGIWRPGGGRRSCPKCAAKKKERARAKLRAEQTYLANFQSFSAPLDPWKSGEIPQRPHVRTPDPAWGF